MFYIYIYINMYSCKYMRRRCYSAHELCPSNPPVALNERMRGKRKGFMRKWGGGGVGRGRGTSFMFHHLPISSSMGKKQIA